MHAHMGAIRPHCLDALDIRFGYFLGLVVGMAHLITAELAFAANFTCSRHSAVLQKYDVGTVKKQSVQYHKNGLFARGKWP